MLIHTESQCFLLEDPFREVVLSQESFSIDEGTIPSSTVKTYRIRCVCVCIYFVFVKPWCRNGLIIERKRLDRLNAQCLSTIAGCICRPPHHPLKAQTGPVLTLRGLDVLLLNSSITPVTHYI